MSRGWSHFSSAEDDSDRQRFSEHDRTQMTALHDGLEEAHLLVDELNADLDSFDFRPGVKRITGAIEDLQGDIEHVADSFGGSVG